MTPDLRFQDLERIDLSAATSVGGEKCETIGDRGAYQSDLALN